MCTHGGGWLAGWPPSWWAEQVPDEVPWQHEKYKLRTGGADSNTGITGRHTVRYDHRDVLNQSMAALVLHADIESVHRRHEQTLSALAGARH